MRIELVIIGAGEYSSFEGEVETSHYLRVRRSDGLEVGLPCSEDLIRDLVSFAVMEAPASAPAPAVLPTARPTAKTVNEDDDDPPLRLPGASVYPTFVDEEEL